MTTRTKLNHEAPSVAVNNTLRKCGKIKCSYEKLEFVEGQGSILNDPDENPVHEEPDEDVDEKKGDWVPLEEVVKGPRRAQAQ